MVERKWWGKNVKGEQKYRRAGEGAFGGPLACLYLLDWATMPNQGESSSRRYKYRSPGRVFLLRIDGFLFLCGGFGRKSVF